MVLHVPSHVLYRNIDGEGVLLHLQSGYYYSLNEVGTVAWETLSARGSLQDAASRIVEDFDVSREEAERDLRELVDDLKSHGLVSETA